MNINSPWFAVLMFSPVALFVGIRLFFALKNRWEKSRRAVLRRETGRRRRKDVLKLIEAFESKEKRACLDDEEILVWLDEGLGLENLFGGEEGQIDCSAFRHWLETSVYRALTKGAIEIFKQDGILHPNVLDAHFVEILTHCEAFEFKLEEFGITRSELEKLLEKKIVAWSQWEFKRYQSETTRLENDWKKVVETLLERNLAAPALKEKFVPVSLSVSESK